MAYLRSLLAIMWLCGCGKVENEGLLVFPHVDSDDRVFFFFDVDCPDCRIVKHELLSHLLEKKAIPDAEVVYLDVGSPSTLEALRHLESVLGFEANIMAPVVVVGRQAYCGVAAIEGELAAGDDVAGPESSH